jgi:hypothetical protein
MSPKSAHREAIYLMRMDGQTNRQTDKQTDRHNEANSRITISDWFA